MKLAVPRTEYHYGWDMPLSDAISEVLDGSTMPVTIVGGRYAFIAGRNGPYLHGRGFMWFDMEQGEALGAFYFQPTNGEPSPTLTVFSRQLTDKSLGMSQLPPEFGEALNQWVMATHAPVVSPTYFIPENGKKYVLMHDRDYCSIDPGVSSTGPRVCEQLDANAADDDMNAAYFMKETHNAANATAWMLGPDQIAWIGMRESRCGIGLRCRIAMTRERTQVLIGRPGLVPRAPRPPSPAPPRPR
ncbi:MAG TPA: lysozyme inhibitor LprI family protein [Terracidiphilus sp.]|nr:lysozyme inhibitor LprI family protein [Terracidiphilus sp.]